MMEMILNTVLPIGIVILVIVAMYAYEVKKLKKKLEVDMEDKLLRKKAWLNVYAVLCAFELIYALISLIVSGLAIQSTIISVLVFIGMIMIVVADSKVDKEDKKSFIRRVLISFGILVGIGILVFGTCAVLVANSFH